MRLVGILLLLAGSVICDENEEAPRRVEVSLVMEVLGAE